jgi:hypothetical protein
MRRLAVLAVAVLAASGLAACGGGGSDGASGHSSSAGSQAASASDKAFCDTFQTASQKFSADNTFPTKSQTGQVRAFADELEATAPSEMKGPAKGLAAYFRSVADGVDKNGSNPSPNPSALAAFAASIQAIGAWAETHCTS